MYTVDGCSRPCDSRTMNESDEARCCSPSRGSLQTPARLRDRLQPEAGTEDGPGRARTSVVPSPSSLPARAAEMICLAGGEFVMGSADRLAYPEDGETPREVEVEPFAIDSHAVSNAIFAEFVSATAYVTEAESIGWSFVFARLLPDDFPPTRAVMTAPWWRHVYAAD